MEALVSSTKLSLILKLVNQVRRPKRPQNFPHPSNTTVACAGGRKSWMITRTNLQFRSVNRFTLELARSWKNQYWIINSLQKNEAIFCAFTLLTDFETNVILNIKEERCFNGSSNEPQKSCYGRVYWRGFVILAQAKQLRTYPSPNPKLIITCYRVREGVSRQFLKYWHCSFTRHSSEEAHGIFDLTLPLYTSWELQSFEKLSRHLPV